MDTIEPNSQGRVPKAGLHRQNVIFWMAERTKCGAYLFQRPNRMDTVWPFPGQALEEGLGQYKNMDKTPDSDFTVGSSNLQQFSRRVRWAAQNAVEKVKMCKLIGANRVYKTRTWPMITWVAFSYIRTTINIYIYMCVCQIFAYRYIYCISRICGCMFSLNDSHALLRLTFLPCSKINFSLLKYKY